MRTKDLVELVILIERGLPDAKLIRRTLEVTFSTRGTHQLPKTHAPPPEFRAKDFPGMSGETDLSTHDCIAAFVVLVGYWNENSLGEL